MSEKSTEFGDVLGAGKTSEERRAAFIESSVAASPEGREDLLRLALEHSESQRETMELAAVAGTLAETFDEKARVFEITHASRPDDVQAEMDEFGVTFDLKNPVTLMRIYGKLKKKYADVRAEAKAAISS